MTVAYSARVALSFLTAAVVGTVGSVPAQQEPPGNALGTVVAGEDVMVCNAINLAKRYLDSLPKGQAADAPGNPATPAEKEQARMYKLALRRHGGIAAAKGKGKVRSTPGLAEDQRLAAKTVDEHSFAVAGEPGNEYRMSTSRPAAGGQFTEFNDDNVAPTLTQYGQILLAMLAGHEGQRQTNFACTFTSTDAEVKEKKGKIAQLSQRSLKDIKARNERYIDILEADAHFLRWVLANGQNAPGDLIQDTIDNINGQLKNLDAHALLLKNQNVTVCAAIQ